MQSRKCRLIMQHGVLVFSSFSLCLLEDSVELGSLACASFPNIVSELMGGDWKDEYLSTFSCVLGDFDAFARHLVFSFQKGGGVNLP